MQDEVVPIIRDYEAVAEQVLSNPEVTAISPQINGMVTVQFDEEGTGFSQLLAVDPEAYTSFFPDSIDIVKGRFLEGDEEGIVLSMDAVEMLEESSGEKIDIGDPVIVSSTTALAGIKIREVPVVGIYDVSVASQMMTSYLDGENMRAINGMTQITDVEVVLTDEEQSGLGAVNEDDLFGGGDFIVVDEESAGTEDTFSVFGSSDGRELYNAIDPNAWHYLLVRLEDQSQMRRMVPRLNEQFEAAGMEVTAYTWLEAAGQVAEMTSAIRLVFNIIIIIIAVVAVIIIMNTLVISVTERIGEIGTMRAIGAQKWFVRRMILFETIVIVCVFGGIGIVLGGVAIGVVNAAQIETENIILQMLAGGSIIQPIISVGSIIVSLFGMLASGVLASLYPASLALRIEPRQAMASH